MIFSDLPPSMMVKERQNDKRIQHDELGESPTNSSGLDVSVAPATKKLRPAPAFVLAVESAFVSGGYTDPHESESASGPVAAADKQGKYIVSCAVQTQDTSLTRRKCRLYHVLCRRRTHH